MHPFIAEQLIADRRTQELADAHHSRLVRAAANNRPGGIRPRSGTRWRHLLGAGIVGLVAAIATFAAGPAGSGPHLPTSHLRGEPVTLVGLKAVASENVAYEPGASRTWSPDSAILSVKVLSGQLTVYTDGERRIYITGEAYAAGWAAYRTANETDERVETLVTKHVRS